MALFARVVDGSVVDVSTDPKNQFHPDLAKAFISAPDNVVAGWSYDGKTWSAPVVPTPTPVAETGNLQPTPPEFMLLLTLQERAAFRAAAEKDPVAADLLSLLSDARLTYVDLANSGVQEAVQYMTTTDPQLLTEARAKRILAGLPPESAA